MSPIGLTPCLQLKQETDLLNRVLLSLLSILSILVSCVDVIQIGSS